MECSPLCQNKTDEELVAASLVEPANFLCLMRRYEERLLRYVFRISSVDRDDAEDVVQNAYIKMYQNLCGFDTHLKFSAWAYRIVRNEVIDTFRRKKARPQTIFSEVGQEAIDNLADRTDLTKKIDNSLRREKVLLILNKLDQKYKEVLELYFLEELGYQEISDILQKPIGTVGTLVSRAKTAFKKEALSQGIKFD